MYDSNGQGGKAYTYERIKCVNIMVIPFID